MPVILAMMGLTISQCADFMTVPSSFVAHCIMEEDARSEVFFVTLPAARGVSHLRRKGDLVVVYLMHGSILCLSFVGQRNLDCPRSQILRFCLDL